MVKLVHTSSSCRSIVAIQASTDPCPASSPGIIEEDRPSYRSCTYAVAAAPPIHSKTKAAAAVPRPPPPPKRRRPTPWLGPRPPLSISPPLACHRHNQPPIPPPCTCNSHQYRRHVHAAATDAATAVPPRSTPTIDVVASGTIPTHHQNRRRRCYCPLLSSPASTTTADHRQRRRRR